MGGHGGLNILPQKKWHVYNRDNREKVEADERLARERQEAEEQRAASARLSLAYSVLDRENQGRDRPALFDLRSQQDLPREEQPETAAPDHPADTSRLATGSDDVTFGDQFRRNSKHIRWYKLPKVDNSELLQHLREEAARGKHEKKHKKRDRSEKRKAKSSKKCKERRRSSSRDRSREQERPEKDRQAELERMRKERICREEKERKRALDLMVELAGRIKN